MVKESFLPGVEKAQAEVLLSRPISDEPVKKITEGYRVGQDALIGKLPKPEIDPKTDARLISQDL